MIRICIGLLVAAILTGCGKQSSGGLSFESYRLPDGPGDLSEDVAGHATAALAYVSIRKHREERSQYAPFATLRRSDHSEMADDQWIEFCFGKIFEGLGFPFSAHSASGIRFDVATYTYTVTHTLEALGAYREYLDEQQRSPQDKYEDLLNGGTKRSEQDVDPND